MKLPRETYQITERPADPPPMRPARDEGRRSGVAGRTPEEIARAFHDAYEALAPHFSYETRPENAKPWNEIPERNRDLMIATVRAVLFEPIGAYPGPSREPSPRDEGREEEPMPADARRALKTLLDRPAEPYYCLTGGVFAVARRCESMVFVTWASTFSERMYANEDDARAALSPALGTAPLIVDGVPVSREEAAAATQVYEQGDDGIEPAERRYRKALASLGTEGR
jgi:hypothetical protein